MRVEEEYPGVMQNLEVAITSTYSRHPEMSDHDVIRVLETIIDAYVAEKLGRSPRHLISTDLEGLLLGNVRGMCDLRLGHGSLAVGGPGAEELGIEPITVDELLLCLKRILKSVERWNKRGGSQGYLRFVSQYIR
ncbi:MAG: hypothetical protein HQ592_13815 [Planctomycetes bacterium]|nr:hypothetical protein [Planctomycetota bacterium]